MIKNDITYRFERPAMADYLFGALRMEPSSDMPERSHQFIISTDARDRHESRLNPAGWQLENYHRNPVVGYQHNLYGNDPCIAPNPDDVIGKGRVWMEGRALIGQIDYEPADLNPMAEKLRQKVEFGSIRATSVGFSEVGEGTYRKESINGREVETYYFEGQELLEFSLVNIPSNPDAVMNGLRGQSSKMLRFVKKLAGAATYDEVLKMNVGQLVNLLTDKETTIKLLDLPVDEFIQEAEQQLTDKSALHQKAERAAALEAEARARQLFILSIKK